MVSFVSRSTGFAAAVVLAASALVSPPRAGAEEQLGPCPVKSAMAAEAIAAALPDNVICRPAWFWETRAGTENNHANIAQSVIDAAGGLHVCGQLLTKTSRPDLPYLDEFGLSSALEGLCVRTRGVRQRQLYRQLIATSLNCALSEANDPETCDEVVRQTVDVDFSECNALCAGTAQAGLPSMQKCIEHLRCFNVGGRIVEDGQCALGTCASQASLYCGMDFDACPLINDKHQSCRKFAGNCYKKNLCQPDLGVCPSNTLRSSRDACKEAAMNDCTVDSCTDD